VRWARPASPHCSPGTAAGGGCGVGAGGLWPSGQGPRTPAGAAGLAQVATRWLSSRGVPVPGPGSSFLRGTLLSALGLLFLCGCVTALAKAGVWGAHSSGRPPPSNAGADPWARGSRRTSWGPFRSSSSTKPHCPSSPLQNGSRALSRPAAPSSTLWAWGCGAQSGTFPAQRPLSPPKSWRQGKEKKHLVPSLLNVLRNPILSTLRLPKLYTLSSEVFTSVPF
jgi:hypothetical protein